MKSRSTKPVIGYRLYLAPPKYASDFGKFIIEIKSMRRVEYHDGTTRPFPLFDNSMWRESVEIQFQSNGDKPHDWYGGGVKLENEGVRFESQLLPWLKRHLGGVARRDCALEIVEILERKAMRVVYSPTFHNFIEAKHWPEAASLRMFYDQGVPGKDRDGCTINAYAKAGATHAEITAAVSKALRESSYCTDEQFAGWVQAGSNWQASPFNDAEHTPPSREEIFGKPAEEAAA